MLKRLLIALPLAAVSAIWLFYLLIPWPIALRWRNPESTSFMEASARAAEERGERLDIRQEWVPLDRISRHLRRAVIIAEDGRFNQHGGVDWAAVREELRYSGDAEFSLTDRRDLAAAWEALGYYRANRDRIRGRSTITQQVAKNVYLSSARSPIRKIEEMMIARRMERFLSKDRILEIYLNIAEWGPGIFGAEAASRHYFSRPASDLTLDQAASLAATLPHPLSSNPSLRPGRMAWRRDLILRQLRGGGPPATVPLEPPGADPSDAPLLGDPVAPEPAAEDGDAPPAEDGYAPPADDEDAPPAEDEDAPPADDGDAPARDRETSPF